MLPAKTSEGSMKQGECGSERFSDRAIACRLFADCPLPLSLFFQPRQSAAWLEPIHNLMTQGKSPFAC